MTETDDLMCFSDTFFINEISGNFIFDAYLRKLEYTIPAGHLHNKKFNFNGKDILISSIFDNQNSPTSIKLFSIENETPKIIDSSRNFNICTGLGDAEGMGNINFFTRYFGRLELFRQGSNGFFDKIIDKIEPANSRISYVGIDMQDVDNDGLSEMLYRDNLGNFFIRKLVENNFSDVLSFNYFTLLGLQNI